MHARAVQQRGAAPEAGAGIPGTAAHFRGKTGKCAGTLQDADRLHRGAGTRRPARGPVAQRHRPVSGASLYRADPAAGDGEEAGAECFDDLAVSAPQLPDKFQGAVDRTPPGEGGSVLDGQSGCDSRGDRFCGRIQRSILFFAGIQAPQRDAAGGVPGPFAAACDPLNQNISRGLNLEDFPKSRNTGLPRARLYAAARLRY